jgi:hypothetical protein
MNAAVAAQMASWRQQMDQMYQTLLNSNSNKGKKRKFKKPEFPLETMNELCDLEEKLFSALGFLFGFPEKKQDRWQWGLYVTPVLSGFCFLLLITCFADNVKSRGFFITKYREKFSCKDLSPLFLKNELETDFHFFHKLLVFNLDLVVNMLISLAVTMVVASLSLLSPEFIFMIMELRRIKENIHPNKQVT